MEFEAIKAWLGIQLERRAKACRLKGILAFSLAPLAVVCSTTLVYWLLRLFTQDRYHDLGDSAKCFWVSLAIIPLTFLGNRLVPRSNLMEERMSGDAVDAAMARSPVGRSKVIMAIFFWILFTGPRLVDWGVSSLREARGWRAQDTHSCAAVLWVLASRHKRVPFEDVEREIPWLNLPAALPELARIPGVLTLKGPPPGLALTDDLRQAIRTGGDFGPGDAGIRLR